MEHNLTQGEGAGVCAQRGGSPLHSVRINEMWLHKEAFPQHPTPSLHYKEILEMEKTFACS